MAKPCACDTRRGLRVRCCGACLFPSSAGGGHVIVLGVEHLGMGDQSA